MKSIKKIKNKIKEFGIRTSNVLNRQSKKFRNQKELFNSLGGKNPKS